MGILIFAIFIVIYVFIIMKIIRLFQRKFIDSAIFTIFIGKVANFTKIQLNKIRLKLNRKKGKRIE